MGRHPIVAERSAANESLAEAATLVRSTQERADGDGYPAGLRHEEIPLGSHVIAVCSAFVAMTTSRPYAPAMTAQAMLETGLQRRNPIRHRRRRGIPSLRRMLLVDESVDMCGGRGSGEMVALSKVTAEFV